MATIRYTITFGFDDRRESVTSIADRLDRALTKAFGATGAADGRIRWVARLSDAPLCLMREDVKAKDRPGTERR